MQWFLALNDSAPNFKEWSDLLKVAVHSAQRHTRLTPNVLYDGSENELTRWLCSRGVRIIEKRSRLVPELEKLALESNRTATIDLGRGTYLRTEIPSLHKSRWGRKIVREKIVLYTDCDVLFVDDLPDLTKDAPRFFAAATEGLPEETYPVNTGVMVMNLPGLLAHEKPFFEKTRAHLAHDVQRQWDQGAYRRYYQRRCDILDPLLNWRPYWGINPEARIVHFHGPKPYHQHFSDDMIPDCFRARLFTTSHKHYSNLWEEMLEETRQC